MIRRPSRMVDLYAWHRAALAGQRPSIDEAEPQCGWFRCRMVRNGPWIPARIWCEQETDAAGDLTAPEDLRAEIDGRPADAAVIWMRVAARPITRQAYDALLAERLSNARMAATHAAYDLTTEPMRPA